MKKLIVILVVFISCSKKEEISKSEALKGRLYKTYSYINANLIDSNEYIYDDLNTVISIKKIIKTF